MITTPETLPELFYNSLCKVLQRERATGAVLVLIPHDLDM